MTVQGLYALQNGFMGAQRSLLFYGDYSEARKKGAKVPRRGRRGGRRKRS